MLCLFVVAFGSCGGSVDEKGREVVSPAGSKGMKRSTVEVNNGLLTPEVLWSFGRLGEFAISPAGDALVYTVKWFDLQANASFTELHWVNIEGNEHRLLLSQENEIYNLYWSRSEGVYFISTQGGRGQIYSVDAEGRNLRRVSEIGEGVEGFRFSHDEQSILYVSSVQVVDRGRQRHPDLPQATAQLYDDLMFRHWDRWDDGTRSHIFLASVIDGQVQQGVDLMQDEPYDSPMPPFGGMEEVEWSPDGTAVVYTCKKLTGRDAAFSTNSDIYLFNVRTRQTVNLSAPNPGYDRCPLYSPDGRYLAWLSMERAGFEADRERLIVMDVSTGQKRELTEGFDHSPSSLVWAADSKGLYFVAGVEGTHQLYYQGLEERVPRAITQGQHDYQSIALAGGWLVASRMSMLMPTELYRVRCSDGLTAQLTTINSDLLGQLEMPTVQKRWVRTTDGKRMLTWVLLPPHFDSLKLYPALLYCEGGPQSSLSQFWSYRWNLALMASKGYVVVAPNRRGVLTFGQEWTDAISKDHGGQEMRDLLAAIDDVAAESWVDSGHLGAVGASYGGFTVNWLAGHHEGRFKAFISHCGVFNSEMEYYTTEELFFDQWEMGGAPWEADNPVARASFAQSPHRFVTQWDTPIMFIHGGRDYRIPYTQALAGFTAARAQGIPSRLLYFPDESHWVLKPQNGEYWQREFFDWLDSHLK